MLNVNLKLIKITISRQYYLADTLQIRGTKFKPTLMLIPGSAPAMGNISFIIGFSPMPPKRNMD